MTSLLDNVLGDDQSEFVLNISKIEEEEEEDDHSCGSSYSHSGTSDASTEAGVSYQVTESSFSYSGRPNERSKVGERDVQLGKRRPTEKSPLVKDGSRQQTHPLSQSVLYRKMMKGKLGDSLSEFVYSRSIVLTDQSVTAQVSRTVMESRTLSLPDQPSDDRLASVAASYCNSMCMIIGIGVYTMPYLAAHGGIAVLGLILLLGWLSWYTASLLLEAQQQQSRSRPNVTKRVYENVVEVGRATIKPYGDVVMKILIMSSALADVYTLIFCAQVTIDLLAKLTNLSKPTWILIWGMASTPTFFIRRMSALAWFGTIAMAIYSAVIISSFFLLCIQPKEWGFVEVSKVFDFETLCVAYGVIANSYCLHLAVPAIEASMKHQKRAVNMFKALFSSNTLIKFVFASMGLLAFGDLSRETVTTNFSIGHYPNMAKFINVGMAVYLYLELPLIMFVVFETVDLTFLPHFHLFNQSQAGIWSWVFLSRVTLSTALIFIGVCLPKLKYVISLIGTIRGTFISFMLPLYFHTKLKRRHVHKARIIFHIVLMVLCAIVGCCGLWFAVKGIIFY